MAGLSSSPPAEPTEIGGIFWGKVLPILPGAGNAASGLPGDDDIAEAGAGKQRRQGLPRRRPGIQHHFGEEAMHFSKDITPGHLRVAGKVADKFPLPAIHCPKYQ